MQLVLYPDPKYVVMIIAYSKTSHGGLGTRLFQWASLEYRMLNNQS